MTCLKVPEGMNDKRTGCSRQQRHRDWLLKKCIFQAGGWLVKVSKDAALEIPTVVYH